MRSGGPRPLPRGGERRALPSCALPVRPHRDRLVEGGGVPDTAQRPRALGCRPDSFAVTRPLPNRENLDVSNGDMERTRLANERTYLAWWRTGIAGVASGFAVGRVVPAVVQGTSWPYVAVGAALTAAGLFAFVYGTVRYRDLDAALREGREPARRDSALLVLAAIGVASGVVSLVLVLVAP